MKPKKTEHGRSQRHRGVPHPIAEHEKRDGLGKQLLDTITVTAFGRIERLKMRFQLRNQHSGVGTVGALGHDDG
jgi:hypothetical protein